MEIFRLNQLSPLQDLQLRSGCDNLVYNATPISFFFQRIFVCSQNCCMVYARVSLYISGSCFINPQNSVRQPHIVNCLAKMHTNSRPGRVNDDPFVVRRAFMGKPACTQVVVCGAGLSIKCPTKLCRAELPLIDLKLQTLKQKLLLECSRTSDALNSQLIRFSLFLKYPSRKESVFVMMRLVIRMTDQKLIKYWRFHARYFHS